MLLRAKHVLIIFSLCFAVGRQEESAGAAGPDVQPDRRGQPVEQAAHFAAGEVEESFIEQQQQQQWHPHDSVESGEKLDPREPERDQAGVQAVREHRLQEGGRGETGVEEQHGHRSVGRAQGRIAAQREASDSEQF